MTSAEPLIYNIEELERFYVSKAEIVKAIDGISLEINKGDFIVVIGPSGSGKTTLLNLLSGLDEPTGGNLYFKGKDLRTLSDYELCQLRRFDIGIIFQFYNMMKTMTAQENVEYPMLIAGIKRKEREHRAHALLKEFNMFDKRNKYPDELSGGEKQRVGIARALTNNPDVIIADEPTGDLDSENAEVVVDLLLKINREQGKTIIMVTHDETLITKNMQIIELESGKLFAQRNSDATLHQF